MGIEKGIVSVRVPTHLDRYPAKMVSRLADDLLDRYALNAASLLDPFCGSGAILVSARNRKIPCTGLDINPIATLLSRVKLEGFSLEGARRIQARWIERAGQAELNTISWDRKSYWFTPKTLEKFERLRGAAVGGCLPDNREGRAVLLSLALSVRLCSRADQRSPKPFISKIARKERAGLHFDPLQTMTTTLLELAAYYAASHPTSPVSLLCLNAVDATTLRSLAPVTHVVTSPPYINAQDYFRNFKLELYVLEGLLPYSVESIKHHFVGTERGDLISALPESALDEHRASIPQLIQIERKDPHLGEIVHRYLFDMGQVFDNLKRLIASKGRLILVCGDNLVGGVRLCTWDLLRVMVEARGFELFDSFADPIENRMLAPKRSGHKGLIKEEVVLAFAAKD